MLPRTCAICLRESKKNAQRPKRRDDITVHGTDVVESERLDEAGFVIVHSKRDHSTHDRLGAGIEIVHIHGHPFVWFLKLIIEKCPDLRKIQVIPSKFRKITDGHRSAIGDREIEIVGGHAKPELAWKKGEMRPSDSFYSEQTFFEKLEGEQAKLWQELLDFGFEEAEITQAYYGLAEGAKPIPQSKLLEHFGFTPTLASYMSIQIKAVIRYLDPSYKCSMDSVDYSRRMQSRVVKIRAIFEKEEALAKFAKSLNLDHLPKGVRPCDFDKLEILTNAKSSGLLERLELGNPRLHDILYYRYGISSETGRTPDERRTLEEVGQLFDLTRERIRQLEVDAFEWIEERSSKTSEH